MITILILAIVLSIAVPSFQSLMNRQALVSKVGLLTSTLAYARNEAVARVQSVVLCGANGASCSGTNDLSSGWLVFTDENEDGQFNTSDGDELLKQGGDGGNQVTLTLVSPATHIRYSDLGESSDVRNIHSCTQGADTDPAKARTVTVSIVGSTRVSLGATCP